MNEIIPFQFEGRKIRVTTGDENEPWCNANDVCDLLEYSNPHKAVADHVDPDDLTKREVIDNLGCCTFRANHVNESGFYRKFLL
jgi:prophage antirepressor-like protein